MWQAEIQKNGLIIVNIGQFMAALAACGLVDLNILLFKHFAEGIGKHGVIINKQNTHGKLP